jgi:hypothetical protein
MFVLIIACVLLLVMENAGDIFGGSKETSIFISKEDLNGAGW